MSRHVTGQVFKVYEKAWKGKVLYSVKLEDNPIYFRMNENRYAGVVEPGAYIEFEAEDNPDGKSAQVKGTPKAVQKAPPTAAAPVGGGFSAGRETHIHYQSARKDALQFVHMIIETGAVKLPTKMAQKLKALEALVDLYTASFLEDIVTGGAVARSTAAAYNEAADEDSPDEDGEDE